MPLVGPKATPTYSVGDRVEFVQYNNYMREYHDVVPGSQGTVSRDPDGELDGPPTGMLVLWDSCRKHVRVSFSEVKKVEEKGSTMTDFKVGDKVKWAGHEGYGYGKILGFHTSPSGRDLVHLRMDKFKDYDDYNEFTDGTYAGLDFHEVNILAIEPTRTLAEKRADDFRVLEEASRPWRNAPDYYKFPHDVQTTDISMHLNSNGGQAVGYISRSTRIDGQNKEDDPRESLRKAIDLIQMEIYRLDEKFEDTK